jgi:hypothetical protein
MVGTMHWFSLYAWLIRDNSLIESTQFGLLVAAVVLFVWVGFHLIRRRNWLGFIYVGIALAAFFVAGEEISWGQNIFQWRPNDWLSRSNFQGETNLHNTDLAFGPTIYGFILVSAYGTLAPLLALRLGERRRPVDYLFVPPLALVPAFFISFAYRAIRTEFDPLERFPRYAFQIDRFSEWAELCLYFAVLVVAVLTWRLWWRDSLDKADARPGRTSAN